MTIRRIGTATAACLSLLILTSLAVAAPPKPKHRREVSRTVTPDTPPGEVKARYEMLVRAAIAEFQDRHWPEARALFTQAHALWPSARTLRSLGMTAFEVRDYPKALLELQSALEDPRRPLTGERRAHVEALLGRTRAFVGELTVTVWPAQARLWIDGQPVQTASSTSAREPIPASLTITLPVGRHLLRADSPDGQSAAHTVILGGGDKQHVDLKLSRSAASAPVTRANSRAGDKAAGNDRLTNYENRKGKRVRPPGEPDYLMTWLTAGAATALGLTSTALWLASDSDFDRLRVRCNQKPNGCQGRDLQSWRTLQTGHQVTLGLALTSGVISLASLLMEGFLGDAVVTTSGYDLTFRARL